jgi:hypothetical protein
VIRSGPIQQAIYSALTADATLMALINGVFDTVDQNTDPPYITIGESASAPDDLLQETGAQETPTLQVWTKDSGMMALKQIMARVYTVLHRQPLTVSGTQTVECRCELSDTLREPDGETRRGVMRFRITTFG